VAYFFDHCASESDVSVSVVEEDFLLARGELVPSVSLSELRHYEEVRDMFEGGARKLEGSGNGNGNAERLTTARSASTRNDATRAQLAATMKRVGSSRDRHAKPNGNHVPTSQVAARASDSEDDYVVRTDLLTLNGNGVGKSKGKGKSADVVHAVGGMEETNGAGEDLYD